jgi:nitrite reductase/ring-hydroxylating ferredoxin subunit
MPWHTVCKAGDVRPGTGLEAVAGDRIVALYNIDGEYFALDGVCPHQGGPLGKGDLQGCIVTCPWHGWQFDVRNGEFQLRKSMLQPKFNTRIVGDEVQVEIDA